MGNGEETVLKTAVSGLSLLNHSCPKRILYPHNGSVNVFRNVYTQKWSRKESVLIA